MRTNLCRGLLLCCLTAATLPFAMAGDRIRAWREAVESWNAGDLSYWMIEHTYGEKPSITNWHVQLKYRGNDELCVRTPLDASLRERAELPPMIDIFADERSVSIGVNPEDPNGAVSAAIGNRRHSSRSPIETFLRFGSGSLIDAIGPRPTVMRLKNGGERLTARLPRERLLEVEFASQKTPDVVRVGRSGPNDVVLEHRVISRLGSGFPEKVEFKSYHRSDPGKPLYACTLVVDKVSFRPVDGRAFEPAFPPGSTIGLIEEGKHYLVQPDGSWKLVEVSDKAQNEQRNAPLGWGLIVLGSALGVCVVGISARRLGFRLRS